MRKGGSFRIYHAGYRPDALRSELIALRRENQLLEQRLMAQNARFAQLETAKREWELTVDASDDLIFLHDAEGRIIRSNRAYAARVGCEPHEVVNRRFQSLFPTDVVEQQVLEELPEGVKRLMTLKSGDTFLCSLFPVEEGGETLYVHVMRDLTDFYGTQQELAESRNVVFESLKGTIRALSAMGQARDPYTSGHQKRVAELAADICRVMGKSEGFTEGVRIASYVHDIGKVGVPAELLAKPGRFNEIEMAYVRQHCLVGYEIFKGIDLPWPVAEVVVQHHERLDGSGYPHGLSGDAITPEARIAAVADVVEAISSHRPYRPALGFEQAMAEVRMGRGELYDADAVDACIRLVERGYRFS